MRNVSCDIQFAAARVRRKIAASSSSSSSSVPPPPAAAASAAVGFDLETQQKKGEGEKYDFERKWYPIGVESDFEWRVSRREPIEIWLLGKRYVVWRKPKLSRGETAQWSVSIDLCPHRLAPLSEGRIEGDEGNLLCSYHGWQFDCGTGDCTALPQAAESLEGKIRSNQQCGLKILPCRSKYGLLWVWPAEEGEPEGDPMEIEPLEALESEEIEAVDNQWYVRDLKYDWDTFIENILDPTHVPFAHHGIQGSRYKPSQFGLKLVRSEGEGGIRANLAPMDPKLANDPEELAKQEGSFIEFVPPFLCRYNFLNLPKNRAFNLCVIGVPTRPGHVRCLFKFVVVNAETLPKFARWLIRKPAWLDHQARNRVFDSDGYLLYLQEKELTYGSKKEWRKKFHMPTSADALVVGFRGWIDKFTNSGPYGDSIGKGHYDVQREEYSKREVLDRYEQHTKHCKACSGALRNTKIIQALAVVSCLVSACTRNVVCCLLSLAGVYFAEKWKQRFIFVDHVHAHQD